jgi:hypothetical protein
LLDRQKTTTDLLEELPVTVTTIWWLQKLWKKIVVSKQVTNKKTVIGRLNLKKLKDVEVKEQCQAKSQDTFAALDEMDTNLDTNRERNGRISKLQPRRVYVIAS